MEKVSLPHSFNYDKGIITATGVINVREFSDREILAELSTSGITIRGANLKITDLDVNSGVLKATGELISLQYGGASTSFLKRLLK